MIKTLTSRLFLSAHDKGGERSEGRPPGLFCSVRRRITNDVSRRVRKLPTRETQISFRELPRPQSRTQSMDERDPIGRDGERYNRVLTRNR